MNNVTFPTTITRTLYLWELGPSTYGESTEEEPHFPVLGMVMQLGLYEPTMFTLTVEYNKKKVRLPFHIDTGGLGSYANEVAWDLIDPHKDYARGWGSTDGKEVLIHGVPTLLHLGMGRTEGVNMLGPAWLAKAGLVLVADFGAGGKGCALVKATPEVRQNWGLPPVYQ